jgi:hypothetical protein
MSTLDAVQLVGARGIVERNVYLTRRYFLWDVAFFVWTVANTLPVVFIAEGVEATGGTIDVDRATTYLLLGAVLWAYLGITFEFLTETVAWERWEGTIEYTFMAPLRRSAHLAGMGCPACCTAGAGRPALRGRCGVLRPRAAERRPPGGAGDRARGQRVLRRHRDDDRRAPAHLPRRRARSSASSHRDSCSWSPGSTTRSRCSPAGCRDSRRSARPPTHSKAPGRRSSTVPG